MSLRQDVLMSTLKKVIFSCAIRLPITKCAYTQIYLLAKLLVFIFKLII